MSRLVDSWFRAGGNTKDIATEAKAEAATFVAKHRKDLDDAMKHMSLIMNDDMEGAAAGLLRGDSCFHSLGAAVTLFMRGMIGAEKAVMAEAAAKLAECEARATADTITIQRHAHAFGDRRLFPPGTEYDLVRAQVQLMSAILSVMQESIVEAMRGFYKLRKAFVLLDAIVAIETKAIESRGKSTISTSTVATDAKPGQEPELKVVDGDTESTDSVVFVDTNNDAPDTSESSSAATTPDSRQDSCPDMEAPVAALSTRLTSSTLTDDSQLDLSDPLDEYIHSGTNQYFGLLLLILSLVPPAFSRILAVVGFRGDRAKGVRLLWRSSASDNVHSTLAGMMLLGYYNGLLGTVDIVPRDADYDDDAECVGPPREKMTRMLDRMRAQYPKSQLWKIERARQLASQHKMEEALELMTTGPKSKMKQLAALEDFELAMYAMVAQDWTLMRDTFKRCQDSSDWSPAMFSYLSGCANLEIYRDAVQRGAGAEETARLRAETEEYLRKAPKMAGRKRLMAKQLPFETFLLHKVARWEDRAKRLHIELADVIGVSPAHEMAYVWGGHKRMSGKDIELATANLSWERCTANPRALESIKSETDELGVWALHNAVMLRIDGKLEDSRKLLEDKIMSKDRSVPSFYASRLVTPADP